MHPHTLEEAYARPFLPLGLPARIWAVLLIFAMPIYLVLPQSVFLWPVIFGLLVLLFRAQPDFLALLTHRYQLVPTLTQETFLDAR